nr:hypothetical protein [Actinomycetota bacterium]
MTGDGCDRDDRGMGTTTEHNEPTTSPIRRATDRLALATRIAVNHNESAGRDRAVTLVAGERIAELLEEAARLA